MAIIVEFPAQTRRATTHERAPTSGAEIVLFPGVRYEYWEEKPAKPKRPRRQAKRDLLELEG